MNPAVLFDGWVFLPTPRTGSRWTRHVLEEAGCVQHVFLDLTRHPYIRDLRIDAKVMTFKRKLWPWYRSLWRLMLITTRWKVLRKAKPEVHPWRYVCATCWDDDFRVFTQNYMERCSPGLVTEHWRRYHEGADWVGDYDHLEDEVIRFMTERGWHFDEEKVRTTPPIRHDIRTPDSSEDLRLAFEAFERRV